MSGLAQNCPHHLCLTKLAAPYDITAIWTPLKTEVLLQPTANYNHSLFLAFQPDSGYTLVPQPFTGYDTCTRAFLPIRSEPVCGQHSIVVVLYVV